jgi:hypothetical protein
MAVTPATLEQAKSTAERLSGLANALSARGELGPAEICAGGALTITCLLASMVPEEPPRPPLRKVK